MPAMLDLREGTNRTGCNPKKEKLVRHIGITGHWNTAAHIYAIQRDPHRLLDTLLVTINPTDCKFMGHRHNAIAAAAAADMGIIGMKIFADAAYYHKDVRFSNSPEDVFFEVGSEEMPSREMIQYALSVDGISTLIIGIGHVDDNPEKCQLEQNLSAAQIENPLGSDEMSKIEDIVSAAGKEGANAYFQRKQIGLTAPRNVGAEADSSMPGIGRIAVRISWDTAYAGTEAIDHYNILRNGDIIGTVPHEPQITTRRFSFDDVLDEENKDKAHQYQVRTVDAQGTTADSSKIEVSL